MKLEVRVGICLAAAAILASCSTAPQVPTAPSANTGGSAAGTGPDGSTLKTSAPALVPPRDRARAEDRRPTLEREIGRGAWGGSAGQPGLQRALQQRPGRGVGVTHDSDEKASDGD